MRRLRAELATELGRRTELEAELEAAQAELGAKRGQQPKAIAKKFAKTMIRPEN